MPDLTPYYNGSFRGTSSFWIQDSGPFTEPGADLAEDYVLLRIPGGNITILQSFGSAPRTLDLPIAINSSDLASLVAKQASSGTLVYHGGSIQARMVGMTQPQRDNLDQGTWKMTLKFVLL